MSGGGLGNDRRVSTSLAVAGTRSDYQGLASIYLPIGVGVFVLVIGILFVLVVRYRDRGDGRAVDRRSEAPVLEAGYVLGLACVAAVLVSLTFHVEGREDARAASPAVHVHAIAARWRWRFTYPGGVVAAGHGGQVPTLVVPRGEPVAFRLDALDVIHAMWVPDLRFKKDAIPGHTNRFDLTFPSSGYYSGMGECSEFCGLYHAEMRFNVDVLEPAAFRAWLSRRQRVAAR